MQHTITRPFDPYYISHTLSTKNFNTDDVKQIGFVDFGGEKKDLSEDLHDLSLLFDEKYSYTFYKTSENLIACILKRKFFKKQRLYLLYTVYAGEIRGDYLIPIGIVAADGSVIPNMILSPTAE